MTVFRRMICLLGLLGAFPVCLFASVQTSAYVNSFAILTNHVGNRSIVFELSPSGQVEVVPFAPDVVRVRFHFGDLYEREEIAIDKVYSNWPAFSHSITQPNSTSITIQTDALIVSIVLSNTFQVHFHDPSGYPMLEDVRMEYNLEYKPVEDTVGYAQIGWPGESSSVSNLPSGFKLRAVKQMGEHDAFFGLGDTAGPLNRRGRAIQFWAQDTYQFGEGRTPKYTALPMMHGVKPASSNHPAFAYGLFFNNPARPVFKLYGPDNTWSFEAGDDQLDYFFFGGGTNHTMARVMDRFSELTGRPIMLPKWALGYHQSRHSYFTQQRVLDVANNMRSFDFPCDAIYLDIGSQKNFGDPPQSGQMTFNDNYTNVVGLVQDTGTLGIKLVPLIEPLLTVNDPLYGEAFTNLYFIKNNDLSTYVGTNFLGRISWLDYSIADSVNWWKGKLVDYLNAYGFEGIWNDLNEPNENAMPLDALWFLDGRYGGGLVTNDSRKWHSNNKNTYNIWEAQVTVEAMLAYQTNRRPFVLSRGAWPGIQKLAAGWSGDNKSTYDHLRFNNPMGLNVMISGQAWFGHDIGGFVDNTSNHLLTRWIQAGSLQPLFRNHTTLDTIDQEPWAFGGDYTVWNRKWIKLRYEMMPFLYSLSATATTNGVAINVPTVFYFTQDTNTFTMNDYEYMVGRDLLVAPVYTQDQQDRSVYLPAGETWYFWDQPLKFTGGQTVTVPASLGYMPIFSRSGAIIPRGPVQYYANEFQPDYLDIHHWPGGTNAFELYEDDGVSFGYRYGDHATTYLRSVSETNALVFTFHAKQGNYDTGVRDYYLIAYDLDVVEGIWVNSNIITRFTNRQALEDHVGHGWAYSAYDRQLTVKLPDDGSHQVVEASFQSTTDTDGDGIPDYWELAFFGGITNAVASADPDGDGRNNLLEYQSGYHPKIADVHFTTNTAMAVAGTFNGWNQKANNMRLIGNHRWAYVVDLTGHSNIQFKFVANNDWGAGNWGDNLQTNTVPPIVDKLSSGSGANIFLTGSYTGWFTFTFSISSKLYSVVASADVDSDGDGLNDEFEAIHGLNPYSAANAFLDTDGDGFTDLQEFIAGTSIIDADSYHYIPSIEATLPGNSLIGWTGIAGRAYTVYFTTNLLATPAWSLLMPYTNVTGSGPLSITDTSPSPWRAYRIDVRKP
ncbi:MAG TPA: glycoside hydrolase family 31 protein [Kiritimatiellia bacterium]|nr:glycoside hydrolase family 31 protein [Kiritimatiellia bacterium]